MAEVSFLPSANTRKKASATREEKSRRYKKILKRRVANQDTSSSLFFRLAAVQRRQLTPAEVTEDEGGVLLEDELAQLEQNNKDEDVHEILSQMGVEHPITYHGYNICDLVKTGTLPRFTEKELRVMSDNFELPRKSTDNKSTLIGHIIDMVKECSCS